MCIANCLFGLFCGSVFVRELTHPGIPYRWLFVSCAFVAQVTAFFRAHKWYERSGR